MSIQSVLKPGDTLKVSKSFGLIGSSAINQSKAIMVVGNDNEAVLAHEVAINKPLVSMINVLASIDGFLKQKFESQKIIARNNQLSIRESQIEASDSQPEIEVIKPDAERVNGSSAGLLALGGLALLTLDPVQEALKSVIDGVVSIGQFVTGTVSSINSVFDFLLSGRVPDGVVVNDKQNQSVVSQQPAQEQTATPIIPESNTPSPEPETGSSFLTNVSTGAITGAAVGSFVPRIGPVIGGAIGGVTGAVSYFTGGGSTSAPAESKPTATMSSSAPTASSGSSAPVKLDATPASGGTGQIPKNDIVALGRYLQGQGVNPSEHPAFGSVGKHSANSRHYRGMAIDLNVPGGGQKEAAIFDALEPQLRAAGYNTIWRRPGHWTHMHVSVGGPEGRGKGSTGSTYGDSTGSMTETVSKIATESLEQIGKLFGVLGSAIIKPGVAKTDVSSIITGAAKELNADMAISKTEKPTPSMPSLPPPPNINKVDGGATQNPATSSDKNSVYYYLRRFGYQDLSVPQKKLVIA